MTLERNLSVRRLQNTNAWILLQGGTDKGKEYLPSLKVILINTQGRAGEETRLAKCLLSTHDPQNYIYVKRQYDVHLQFQAGGAH